MNTLTLIKNKMALFVPLLALMGAVGFAPSVFAANPNCSGTSVLSGATCAKSTDQRGNIRGLIKTATDVLLFILGAIAVIMIIIGGIRYTTSNGDSSQVTAAKNTILYGVIGVIVALLAYAIVNFVVTSFVAQPGGQGGGGNTNNAVN